MKVTFLGTGTSQGIPVIGSQHPVCKSHDPRDKRLRVSIAISWNDVCYVIDCGPDFRQQMLHHAPAHLTGLLLTHEHADHTAGLDDIRPFFFRQGKINMWMSPRVHQELIRRFDYIFSDKNKYPGAPSVHVEHVEKQHPFFLDGKKVTPIEVMHHRLPVLGYRIENFAYLTDVKTIDKEGVDALQGLEVLVINALRIEPHPSHLNLSEALALIDQLTPQKAYLTHISHLLGFHAEVEKELPPNVFLAYDNLEIYLDEK